MFAAVEDARMGVTLVRKRRKSRPGDSYGECSGFGSALLCEGIVIRRAEENRDPDRTTPGGATIRSGYPVEGLSRRHFRNRPRM